ncbi:hypothetical protein D3C83_45270 [compost metagenome]
MRLENPLHAFAVRNLSHREGGIQSPVSFRNDDALIGLQALFFALADLDPDFDGVAVGEVGEGAFGGKRLGLLALELFDNIGHDPS